MTAVKDKVPGYSKLGAQSHWEDCHYHAKQQGQSLEINPLHHMGQAVLRVAAVAALRGVQPGRGHVRGPNGLDLLDAAVVRLAQELVKESRPPGSRASVLTALVTCAWRLVDLCSSEPVQDHLQVDFAAERK